MENLEKTTVQRLCIFESVRTMMRATSLVAAVVALLAAPVSAVVPCKLDGSSLDCRCASLGLVQVCRSPLLSPRFGTFLRGERLRVCLCLSVADLCHPAPSVPGCLIPPLTLLPPTPSPLINLSWLLPRPSHHRRPPMLFFSSVGTRRTSCCADDWPLGCPPTRPPPPLPSPPQHTQTHAHHHQVVNCGMMPIQTIPTSTNSWEARSQEIVKEL
jgi:hypothetical protein